MRNTDFGFIGESSPIVLSSSVNGNGSSDVSRWSLQYEKCGIIHGFASLDTEDENAPARGPKFDPSLDRSVLGTDGLDPLVGRKGRDLVFGSEAALGLLAGCIRTLFMLDASDWTRKLLALLVVRGLEAP